MSYSKPPNRYDVSKQSFYTWAYDHHKPDHPKYQTLSHSLYASVSNTIIFMLACLSVRYSCFQFTVHSLRPQSTFCGVFLLLYLVVMIGSRYYENGSIVLYQTLWACNLCLLLTGISLITQDSFFIRVCLVTVCVDQFLWYVDILSFVLRRRFIIGVAKYIIWPETSKIRLATTFHHLWYLPLCLWQIHPTTKYSGFTFDTYLMACFVTLALACVGRSSTPKQILVRDGDSVQAIYMNLNISYELWKDVRIEFLEYCYTLLPGFLVPFGVSFFWNSANIGGFMLFWGMETLMKAL